MVGLALACTPPAQAPSSGGGCDEAAVRSELRAHRFLRFGKRSAGRGRSIGAYIADVRSQVHDDRVALCGAATTIECAEMATLEHDLDEADGANNGAIAAWGATTRALSTLRDTLRNGCGHGERTARCAEAEQLRAAIGAEGERAAKMRLARIDALRPSDPSLSALYTQARELLGQQIGAEDRLAAIERAVAGRVPMPPENALAGRCTQAWAGTWRGDETPDPRAITVSIAVEGSAARAGLLRRMMPNLGVERVSNEWIGSGFVLAGRGTAGETPLIVTNRHVVEGGTTFALTDGHGASLGAAHPVYVDPEFDLALLAPETPLDRSGVRVTEAPLLDLAPVVAVGFPGLGGRPSYQITTGKVSNGDVTENDEGRTLHFVQHTAAIDPGNSGGPLFDEKGFLLGVNTLKASTRESTGFAIPRSALAEAAAHAFWDDTSPPIQATFERDPERYRNALRSACIDLLATLEYGGWRQRHDRISEDAIPAFGHSALDLFGSQLNFSGVNEGRAFEAVAYVGLSVKLGETGGVSPQETCANVGTPGGTPSAPSVRIETLRAPRDLYFRWERGRYLLTGISVAPPGTTRPADQEEP